MTTDEWLDTSLMLHVSDMLPNPVVKKPSLQTAADCCRFKRHSVDHSSSHVLLVRTWTLSNRHTSEAEKGRPTSRSCSQHKLSKLTWRNCTVMAQDDGRSEHPTHHKFMSAVGPRASGFGRRGTRPSTSRGVRLVISRLDDHELLASLALADCSAPLKSPSVCL